MADFYQILGVPPDADAENIRQRYRFLAKAYHPDRFTEPEAKAQAEEEMKRINEAYTVISNPEKRAVYDQKMAEGTKHGEEPASRAATAEYFNSLTNYFGHLFDKWHALLQNPPDIQDLDSSLFQIFNNLSYLVKTIYGSDETPRAKAAIETAQQALTALMMMSMSLGAELATQGIPSKYKLAELQMFSAMPFFAEVSKLVKQASTSGTSSPGQLDRLLETLVDYALRLSAKCTEVGITRVKQPQANRQTSASSPASTRKPAWQSSGQEIPKSFCQSCFQFTPTENLTFRQNIGMVFMRHYRRIEGNFCAACAEQYFWRFTGITMLLGWWGMISFIVSPFFILGNLYNYLKAWKLRPYASGLASIALGWKFTVFSIIGIFIFLFSGGTLAAILGSQEAAPRQAAYASNPVPQVQPTARPIIYPTATRYTYPTSTPEPDCTLWSDISAYDKGKTLCVYGKATNSYFSDDQRIFYITFSKDSNAFRLIVLNGYYYKDVNGDCVTAKGTVKTYDRMPYIEVSDNLYGCRSY